mmetsp:Transcript_6026/g.19436  ORF Transcript_6026/g.19436 Transcript_6026/m.19436 type:complete len:210 (+) Transcript_6026:2-631(+)
MAAAVRAALRRGALRAQRPAFGGGDSGIGAEQRRGMALLALDGGALRPRVDASAWVAPSATVIGDVQLGPRASVWFNACLRGDRDSIIIGEDTNVQDGSVLHTDAGIKLVLGKRVTIGHMVMLHGCTVADDTLIGIGATILNRAKIGSNCLIGAGAMVTEGKEIPDGSVVMGVNKIVRQVTPEDIAMIKLTAKGYVQNQERYRTTMSHL